MKTLAACVLVAASIYAASASAACEPGKVAQAFPGLAGRPVKVGTTPFYAPYEYVDASNPDKMIGSDIEISETALECVGLKYDYTKGVFTSLLPSLTSGQTDVMVGNLYYRPERAKVVDFVVYMRGGGALLVRKGNPRGIRSMDDLCGLSTNVVAGTFSQPIIEAQSEKCAGSGKPRINAVVATETDAALRGLQNGRADFVLDNVGGAAVRVMNDPDTFEVAFTRTEDVAVGIAVKKGNEELLQAYYQGIKAMQENGTITRIFAKYKLDPSLIIPVEIKR